MTNPSPTTICSRIDTHSGLLHAFSSRPRKPAPPAGTLARVSALAPSPLPPPVPGPQGCRARSPRVRVREGSCPSVLPPPRAAPDPGFATSHPFHRVEGDPLLPVQNLSRSLGLPKFTVPCPEAVTENQNNPKKTLLGFTWWHLHLQPHPPPTLGCKGMLQGTCLALHPETNAAGTSRTPPLTPQIEVAVKLTTESSNPLPPK